MREVAIISKQLFAMGLLLVVIVPATTLGFVGATTAKACAWLVEATYEFVEEKLFREAI